jgi:hypothetical protein
MFLYPQMTKPHIIKYLTDVVVQHNGIRISETQQEQMEQEKEELTKEVEDLKKHI